LKAKYITYIYLAILLLGSLLPINGEGSALNNNYTLNIRWDYLLHGLVYLPLSVLVFAAIRNTRRISLIILVIALTIATGLETMQMLVPYRSFNINDLVANGVGVMTGWMLMMLLRKKVTAMIAK
jgi:VanZ family protein